MLNYIATMELGKRWGRGYRRDTFEVFYDGVWGLFVFKNSEREFFANMECPTTASTVVDAINNGGVKIDGIKYTVVLNVMRDATGTVEETTTEETTTEETTTEETTTEETTTEETTTEETTTEETITEDEIKQMAMRGIKVKVTKANGKMICEFNKWGAWYIYIDDGIRGQRMYREDVNRIVNEVKWFENKKEWIDHLGRCLGGY